MPVISVSPPEFDTIEDALLQWLVDRLDDEHVIMVHTDQLLDVESFFGRYNMENNIIVYKIESADDNFLKVLFGLPYSE